MSLFPDNGRRSLLYTYPTVAVEYVRVINTIHYPLHIQLQQRTNPMRLLRLNIQVLL